MWLISADCIELADAIPLLVADENKEGDVLKTESIADDVADSARYGLKSMLAPRGKPLQVLRAEAASSIDEKYQRIMQLREQRTQA
jgi:hypothetical protein